MRRASGALLAVTALLGACHPTAPKGPAPTYDLSTVLAGQTLPAGLATGAEGLYVSSRTGVSVVGPEGQPRMLAIVGPTIQGPAGVAAATGSLFIADPPTHRVWRLLEGGTPEVFAGAGTNLTPIGDGGLAVSAQFDRPVAVAVGARDLYIADVGQHRVRQVDADGRVTTIAGTGQPGDTGDGGLAAQANLNAPMALALGPQGRLYLADSGNHAVRLIGPDGRMQTVAGNGRPGFSGDGGPAAQAQLSDPTGLAVLPDGNLLVSDTGNHRVRWVQPGGLIQTVAGDGTTGTTDEGPASEAHLSEPGAIAVAPDGTPFFVDHATGRVYQLHPRKEATASAR
jgi:serine/threonine-protein kinase